MKNQKIIAVEYCKTNPELFNIWDEARIKNAFNNGRGAIEDLKRYAKDNKRNYNIVFCV